MGLKVAGIKPYGKRKHMKGEKMSTCALSEEMTGYFT